MRVSRLLLGMAVAALSVPAGVQGIERFGLTLAGQPLAAGPSPLLTVAGAGAVLVLGCWLGLSLLRQRQVHLTLIVAWSGAGLMLAVLGHLNHVAYAARCARSIPATVQVPVTQRCLELQRRAASVEQAKHTAR